MYNFMRKLTESLRDYNIIVERPVNPTIRGYVLTTNRQKLTSTPNSMILWYDVSTHDMAPMDESTERLYDAIMAVSPRIIGVTISAYELEVSLEWRVYPRVWLSRGEERRLLQVIADHLGWNEPPRPFYCDISRAEEERRIGMMTDATVVHDGVEPTRWWNL